MEMIPTSNTHEISNQMIMRERNYPNKNHGKWIAEKEQRRYSAKLIEALRYIRRNKASATAPSRAFREAADRALAVAARGRSRWSRAILSRRLGERKKRSGTVAGRRRLTKWTVGFLPSQPEKKKIIVSGEERRRRVLGGLVPGCRKLELPNLLEEAADYIGALEMQVRAMAALAELLTSSSVRSQPYTI